MRSVNWDFLSVHLDTSLPSQKWPTCYPSHQSKNSVLSSGRKSGHFFEGVLISLCMTFIFAFRCPQFYHSGYDVKMDFYFTLCKYSLNLASRHLGGVEEKAFGISQWNLIWACFVKLSQCFKQNVIDLHL